jgi:erythromycin esterase-like protein
MGANAENAELSHLARAGKAEAADLEKLPAAFEQVAAMTAKVPDNYYVVSYCSPGRSGERTLNIDVEVIDDALEVQKGRLETRFDATDFGPGCSSTSLPNFEPLKSAASN